MPLVRRIPKRGFHNRWAETVAVVNLGVLERHFQSGEEVTARVLRGARASSAGSFDLLKVLGNGELTKSLKISAHKFSRSAAWKRSRRPAGRRSSCPARSPW